MDNESRNKKWKIIFFWIYLAVAISLIVISFVYRNEVFLINVSLNSWYIYYRLIWCLSLNFLGFAILVLSLIGNRGIHDKDSPFPNYITLYPFLLFATSAFVFGVLNIYYQNMGVLFYAISGSICFLLGYYIDSLRNFIGLAINRGNK